MSSPVLIFVRVSTLNSVQTVLFERYNNTGCPGERGGVLSIIDFKRLLLSPNLVSVFLGDMHQEPEIRDKHGGRLSSFTVELIGRGGGGDKI